MPEATREQIIKAAQHHIRKQCHHAAWLSAVEYRNDPFDQALVNRIIENAVESLNWMMAHPEADEITS